MRDIFQVVCSCFKGRMNKATGRRKIKEKEQVEYVLDPVPKSSLGKLRVLLIPTCITIQLSRKNSLNYVIWLILPLYDILTLSQRWFAVLY